VAGKPIQTIEGLGSRAAASAASGVDRRAGPAVRLLPERHADGGGALLDEKPKPSDADIDEAMTNICRCGTYQRVRLAIKRAAGVKA
jgi:isoquinoline 1-oxidoreductase alpha subunit